MSAWTYFFTFLFYICDCTVIIMPKETFRRLKLDKKQKITDAFLREFALKTYDEASISSVVKELGIAKGSIYQYFENKLDLFLYLAMYAGEVKSTYVSSVKRSDYVDYWTYMRAMYIAGIQFDKNSPLASHFLFFIEKNRYTPSIKQLYDNWLKQIISAFQLMVQHEVDLGLFHKDLAVDKMAFILYKSFVAINDYMQFFYELEIENSIKNNQPVYSNGKDEKLLKAVDENILIIKKSFEK